MGLSALAQADNKDLPAAQDAFRKGDLKALATYADQMQGDSLGAYPRYWLLSKQIDSIDAASVQAFLTTYQGTWLAEKLRGDWLRSLGKRGDWVTFRNQFALLTDAPGTDLVCYNYSARLAAGEPLAPREARAELWFTPKDLPSSCDSVLESLISSNTVVESDMWARLRLVFEANNQNVARHLSRILNEEIPANTFARIAKDPAKFLVNAPTGTRMNREVAIYALSRLVRTDIDAAYARLKALDEQMGPQKAYAWRVLAVGGARKNDPRAPDWFKASDSAAYTDYQQEWHIRSALRAQDWDTVIAGIRDLSDDGRDTRAWQYWLARALEAKKMPVNANKIFAELSRDDDYYGLLARDRLGPVVGPAQQSYKATPADLLALKGNTGLQRALTLYELDLRPEGVKEWNWALRGADDRTLLAAAEQANAVGWYDRAIYAAERTKQLHNFSLRYIAPYREVTRGYAQDLGLDEAWVYGLIRQESRFATAARSGVGASGLMQIMPTTAQWVANRMGIRYHAGMSNEVGTNVQLGTYYLKHVLETLSNNPVLATAGYNAGPSRAREWQGEQPMEAAIYIEGIPFFETRDYVRKVMTNAVYYSQSFGQNKLSLTQRMGTIPARNAQPIEGP